MSAKADKGDRKREIEQSPMKKKFRDSAISREDLDEAIANRIELAFKEHQSTLNSVVNSPVRDAMDSVLIPALRELRDDIQATNKSVKELREEFEAIATETTYGFWSLGVADHLLQPSASSHPSPPAFSV